MLFSILSSNMPLGYKLLMFLISVLTLLPALTLHEVAHGYAAKKCGDPTANSMGRLSLNPLDHLDPMGALMMLLVGFGWAKPVPINTRYFKKPRRDIAIVSLAGPVTNFVLAFLGTFLGALWQYTVSPLGINGNIAFIVSYIFYYFSMLNLGLGLFNLIPIPPLDGSNVVMCMLPPHMAAKYARIRFYTQYILLGIILIRWLPAPLDGIGSIIFMPLHLAREGLMWLFETASAGFWGLFFG